MRAALRACLPAAAVILFTARSRSDTMQACVSAVTSGQKLQRAGQLRAAREAFLGCDKSECPAEVRTVCDRLINAVEASLPTVVFGAKDANGNDLVAVRVRLDGVPLAESMDGKAVAIDPGPHVLEFRRADGVTPLLQNVVIREAEKNRPVVVTFPKEASALASSADPDRPRRPVPVLAYVLGGVGVAALGAFVALDVDGQSRYDACKAAGCPSSLSAERDVAFVTVGVGVVSLGLATWLFLARPTERRATPALSVDVDALPGGGRAFVSGRF